MSKDCVIVAGGNSVSEGVETGLWDKLKESGIEVWSVNYAFRAMKPLLPTKQLWCDTTFFKNNIKDLEELAKSGVECHTKKNDRYNFINNIIQHECTRKPEEKDNKVFIGALGLSGMFSLSLAVQMKYDRIFLCYGDKTEVFTDKGWKLFKDLDKEQDLILTRYFDGKTDFKKINHYLCQDYDGIVYKLKSKGIELTVTPEHKFALLNKNKIEYTWQTAENLSKNTHNNIPRDFIWTGEKKEYFELPKATQKTQVVPKFLPRVKMNSFLRFLGLYLAEGCCTPKNLKNRDFKITIYQKHTLEKDNFIKSTLDDLGIHYKYHKRGWIIYHKQLTEYLQQFGKSYEKFIPREFLSLCSSHLVHLFDGLIFGDGFRDKNGVFHYYTTSKQLADDVQELSFKLGYVANLSYSDEVKVSELCTSQRPRWSIYINNSKKKGNFSSVNVGNLLTNKKVTKHHYKGKVYDVNIDNHVIFVRENGKPVWSGNCGMDFGVPNQGIAQTHFYQGKMEYISTGVGRSQVYLDGNSPKKAVRDFDIYKDIPNIFNVSLISNIQSYRKIGYPEFYGKISKKEKDSPLL